MKSVIIKLPDNLYNFLCKQGALAMDLLNSEERDIIACAIQEGEVIQQEETAELKTNFYTKRFNEVN